MTGQTHRLPRIPRRALCKHAILPGRTTPLRHSAGGTTPAAATTLSASVTLPGIMPAGNDNTLHRSLAGARTTQPETTNIFVGTCRLPSVWQDSSNTVHRKRGTMPRTGGPHDPPRHAAPKPLLTSLASTARPRPRGVPVYVDSNGQLGTSPSSLRFKEQVRDMGDSTSALMKLRPVTFLYKPDYAKGDRTAAIRPDRRKRSPRSIPSWWPTTTNGAAVQRAAISTSATMLLNEVQKQYQRAEKQSETIETQQQQIKAQQQEIDEPQATIAGAECDAARAPLPAGGFGSRAGADRGAGAGIAAVHPRKEI